MGYGGKTLMGRDVIAHGVAEFFPNRKAEAEAVIEAESHRSVAAWHDNIDEHGVWTSRDLGLGQISAPARLCSPDPYKPSAAELKLRTFDKDPAVYLPVVRRNIEAMRGLYAGPWVFGDGKHEPRQWQPWVAYTSGWALYPEAWCWHHDAVSGKPFGPWVATGRYLHKAIRAVANWHLLVEKDMGSNEALHEAERLADVYGITRGVLSYDKAKWVYWTFPLAPPEPPANPADAYPKRNDGRSDGRGFPLGHPK